MEANYIINIVRDILCIIKTKSINTHLERQLLPLRTQTIRLMGNLLPHYNSTLPIAIQEEYISLQIECIKNNIFINPIVQNQKNKYRFEKFRNERFRELKNGYQELIGERVEFQDIKKAYKTWLADNLGTIGKSLSPRELLQACQDAFGEPEDGKTFLHLRVFLNECDVEEFDKEHQTLLTSTL